MQLNRKTDYAFRTLIFLALQQELTNIDTIANRFAIARDHLTKIISRLAKLNYIIAIRGKGGGLKLNPNTLKLSLAEIANQFESSFKVINCEKPVCPINGVCRLNRILEEASNAFLATLGNYTLNDLLPTTAKEEQRIRESLQLTKHQHKAKG